MTRRRLLLGSLPVVVVLLALAARMMWTGVTENAVLQHFSDGVTAAREDRLTDAESDLLAALAGTDPADSCAVRVNLELVQETLGDRMAFRSPEAVDHYRNARQVVEQAPSDCFAGNTDPDPDRRTVRENAAARLDDKIAAVTALPPPPPLPPPPVAIPPPPVSGGAQTPEDQRLLYPDRGDPLEKLGEILRDAAS